MVRTYGLTHVGLAVRSAQRALEFYRDVFGAREVWRGKGSIQVSTPGSHDVIAFEESKVNRGKMAGVTHFGFRLVDPKDIDAAATAIERAGGKVVERGEFVPGEPYVFATDPDGYTIEVWYE